jgi:GNAT superfamily N-acetyltransferase
MFCVRTATTDDARILGDLEVRSARFAYENIGSPEYLASLQPETKAIELEQKLTNPPSDKHRILIAEESESAKGFAEIEKVHNECGLLHKMYFVPESLGRGLGTVLHDVIIEQFQAWGCTHARLTFVQGNARAEAFYLRNGWTPSGELIPFDDHGRTLIDVVLRRSVDPNPPTIM